MSYLDKPILSVEEFRKIRDELISKMSDFSHELDNDSELSNITDPQEKEKLEDKKVLAFFNEEYFPIIDKLRGYNLSSIPASEWESFYFYGFDEYIFDLSDTGANIDFSIVREFMAEKYNLKGCNLSNIWLCHYLYEDGFDTEILDAYRDDVFLPTSFPKEFRQKYYTNSLSISDLASLPDEQLREISGQYGFEKHIAFSPEYYSLIKKIGDFQFLVDLFKYSENDFNDVLGVLRNFSWISTYRRDTTVGLEFEKLYADIKAADKKDVKNIVYAFIRDFLIDDNLTFLPDNFPDTFINENKDLFLVETALPEEIRERYFARKLTMEDLITYIDELPSFSLDYFRHYKSGDFWSFISTNYGKEKFQSIVKRHKDLFQYLVSIDKDLNISKYFRVVTGDLEEDFLQAIKYYVSTKYISDSQLVDDNLPDAIKNLNFSFIQSINSIDELQKIDKFTIVLDEGQRDFLYLFGVDNIKRLEKERGLFSFEDEKIFKIVCGLLKEHCQKFNENYDYLFDYSSNFMRSINFDNWDYSYESFMRAFSKLLTDSKKLLIDNYNNDMYDKEMYRLLYEVAPNNFIDPNAPYDLLHLFMTNSLTPELAMSEKYFPYLADKNLENIVKFDKVKEIVIGKRSFRFIEFCSMKFGNQITLDLLTRMSMVDWDNSVLKFSDLEDISLDDLIDYIDMQIYQSIIDGKTIYNENLPDSFKKKYPRFFLPENVPDEIKEKFYNRLFTIEDFKNNPELLKYFRNTDIALAFDPSCITWLNQEGDENSIDEINIKKLKIIEAYRSIDFSVRKHYCDYITEHFDSIDDKALSVLNIVLNRLVYSNSAKLAHLCDDLTGVILQSDDPLGKLEEIEQIYLSNHLPDVAKTYSVFRVFHTNSDGSLKINDYGIASPFLSSNHNLNTKEIAIFSDLIRASIDSNSKSVRDYIDVIVTGDKLYKAALTGNLEETDKEEVSRKLHYYSRVLMALYNNSLRGKNSPYNGSDDVLTDIGVCVKLLSPDGSIDYDVPNRVTRMFLHFAGFDSIEELTSYIDDLVEKTTEINKKFSKDGVKLHKGQLIKGIKSVDYLHFNLQNGCVSSDFLGGQAKKEGDFTPLDIDVAYVMDDDVDIDSAISKSCASSYGPPWVIVDADEDFYDSTDNPKYQKGKYELFSAKVGAKDWYGVRTGFGSTKIRCIIVNNYTEKIGFEIALAGFYIPVKDMQGKLLFTYEDYENIVAKMAGLKHYGKPEFSFSPNLATPEIDDLRREKLADKERVTTLGGTVKKKIYEAISSFEFLPGKNLSPKDVMDGDLTAGFVEVIDTGSTGRGTNAPGDGDFDFMLRIDNDILRDSNRMNKLRRKLCEAFGVDSSAIDGKGEIRIKGVEISPNHKVDVDISFKPKTDEINYSTDMCLKDRLSSIKKQDPEKYEYVAANICYAKKVLQEAGCYYKHGHSKCTGKGGLGGVGVENWILQNGGSFVDAIESFLEAAYKSDKTGFVSWDEFKKKYHVWDFGENFREGRYDEFVHDNMDQAGYEAMCECLKKLQDKYRQEQSKSAELSDMLEDTVSIDEGIGALVM